MITPDTKEDIDDVLEEVEHLRLNAERWAELEAELGRLRQAVTDEDDAAARSVVEKLGKRTRKLPDIEVDPQAEPPPEGVRATMERVNKLVRSVAPDDQTRAERD
jgi:hypothetical protein